MFTKSLLHQHSLLYLLMRNLRMLTTASVFLVMSCRETSGVDEASNTVQYVLPRPSSTIPRPSRPSCKLSNQKRCGCAQAQNLTGGAAAAVNPWLCSTKPFPSPISTASVQTLPLTTELLPLADLLLAPFDPSHLARNAHSISVCSSSRSAR
jgi:hypothetical protein